MSEDGAGSGPRPEQPGRGTGVVAVQPVASPDEPPGGVTTGSSIGNCAGPAAPALSATAATASTVAARLATFFRAAFFATARLATFFLATFFFAAFFATVRFATFFLATFRATFFFAAFFATARFAALALAFFLRDLAIEHPVWLRESDPDSDAASLAQNAAIIR